MYQVSDDELAWARLTYPAGTRPRLAIQMAASVANRQYPAKQWIEVIRLLIKRGWEIFALGAPGQLRTWGNGPNFRNLTLDGLDFRQSAAVFKTCAAFAGIDSVWVHMAHALDIPAVALYGPFDWKTRTIHAPLTTALSGLGECAPCNWHMHAGSHFPPDKPCSKVGKCVVLETIKPETIVAKVDALRPN